ncbi:hypothetical protein Tco_0499993 [Tanacetum coccineum]
MLVMTKLMKKQHGEKSETRNSGHEDHVSEITPSSSPITPPSAPRLNWICQTTPGAPMQRARPMKSARKLTFNSGPKRAHRFFPTFIPGSCATGLALVLDTEEFDDQIMAPPPLAIERVPLRYWEPL